MRCKAFCKYTMRAHAVVYPISAGLVRATIRPLLSCSLWLQVWRGAGLGDSAEAGVWFPCRQWFDKEHGTTRELYPMRRELDMVRVRGAWMCRVQNNVFDNFFLTRLCVCDQVHQLMELWGGA